MLHVRFCEWRSDRFAEEQAVRPIFIVDKTTETDRRVKAVKEDANVE